MNLPNELPAVETISGIGLSLAETAGQLFAFFSAGQKIIES